MGVPVTDGRFGYRRAFSYGRVFRFTDGSWHAAVASVYGSADGNPPQFRLEKSAMRSGEPYDTKSRLSKKPLAEFRASSLRFLNQRSWALRQISRRRNIRATGSSRRATF